MGESTGCPDGDVTRTASSPGNPSAVKDLGEEAAGSPGISDEVPLGNMAFASPSCCLEQPSISQIREKRRLAVMKARRSPDAEAAQEALEAEHKALQGAYSKERFRQLIDQDEGLATTSGMDLHRRVVLSVVDRMLTELKAGRTKGVRVLRQLKAIPLSPGGRPRAPRALYRDQELAGVAARVAVKVVIDRIRGEPDIRPLIEAIGSAIYDDVRVHAVRETGCADGELLADQLDQVGLSPWSSECLKDAFEWIQQRHPELHAVLPSWTKAEQGRKFLSLFSLTF